MTVQNALLRGIATLREAGIDGANRDARRLMAAALDVAPGRLTLHLHGDLSTEAEARFMGYIDRRSKCVPVSHLVGGRAFYGRWFTVTGDVLDPRPETETLIETALEFPFASVLDLGTGSGAIALTLMAERPNAQAVATDMSREALTIARQNAESLGLSDRVKFKHSDWYAALHETYDLIVSNPPYIALDEMAELSPELSYEPRMALTDEGDGLVAYRAITEQAGRHLVSGGRLLVEIGWQQGAAVVELFIHAGFAEVNIVPDLDGRDRVVSGFWP
ncbi:Release factor glutamine methyltransferase [Roseovarius albus]|uniref:Release factor glutamine methyltransferase n=1 Tax=Roseovarius albus TaxID=1247867 RepID=A0A1X6YDC7_9RHOB|nr:peptide chain release factor N(5)-glutamine methyltransferase [Roseovarius albus]SLN16158.1 Release factor glutamine methyltransferase [Roseovarius albus]